MAKQRIEREDLTPETELTVKDASRFTRMSIPAFYTERNKGLLGFPEKSEKRQGEKKAWLIKVSDLIAAGFLTADFEPTKSERIYGDPSLENEEVSFLKAELERISNELAEYKQQLAIVMNERDSIQAIADDRAKQLEMINALITATGLRKD